MNKKAKILILSLAIVGSISIGAAAFVQFNDKVYASETNSGSQTGETYVVRFVGADNKEIKKIECQSGDTLDILDAPYYLTNTVWKATTNDQDGNPVFLNTHPEINQAYIFKEVSENDASLQGKVMPSSQNIGPIEESYYADKINEVDLYTWDEFIYHNTWKTLVVGTGSNILDGHYEYDGSASNLVNQKKADTYIGLQSVKNEQITKHNYSYSNNSWSQTTQAETNTVTATPYINEVIDTSSSSSISNYCPIRIQLQNDVVLTGSLTLGARLGISDNATDWGQSKLQNIINGAYAELDLNGYNLIIAEGGSIDAYGSITDSKGTGNLIIENGATMWATMVVEDAAREDSYPTQYLYGGQVTNFFKCPYLNCNIIFKQGCNFYAKLGIRLGGNMNVGTWQDLLIIGNSSDSDAFIQFTSDSLNGQIQRETTFNEDIYESGSTFAKYNLMDMQIEYSLLAGKVNVNDFTISYEYKVTGLGGFSGGLPSNRSPLFIPPYYRFHLYKDTVATLYNLYIFMPSSYLIIDEDAEVILSATGKSETKFKAEGLLVGLLGLDVPEFEYQGVGGLYFLSYYQPFSEGYKYVDTSKRSEGDGYGATIYSTNDRDSTNNAFNFYNGYPAYCELKGKITTDDNQKNLKRNYILAGHFDVANAAIDSFKTTLNKVQTYVSTYQIGPSRFADGKSGISKFVKINIIGYYSSPLIVKVITDNQEADKYKVITPLLSGETAAKNLENTNLNRTYERLDQLIKQGDNTYYTFIMNDVADATEQNVSFYNDRKAEFETTLVGSFRKVTYDSEEDTITFNNEKYLLYQGAYLKCAGEVSHTSITKLWGYGAGKTAKSSTEFNSAPDCYLNNSQITFELNNDVLNQPITDAKKENGQVVYTRVPNKSWKLTGNLPKPFEYK